MEAKTKQREIPVGSGYLYVMEFTGDIPENSAIETAENHIGDIEKGFTVTHKATNKALKDDNGRVCRLILTEEEVTAKCGLITWDYKKLDQMCSTARVTEDASKGVRTIKIGGMDNDSGKRYLFHFYHPDRVMGDVRVTLVGTNTGGLSLAYVPDDATKWEPEITAQPCDNEGTLLIFEESIPVSGV